MHVARISWFLGKLRRCGRNVDAVVMAVMALALAAAVVVAVMAVMSSLMIFDVDNRYIEMALWLF